MFGSRIQNNRVAQFSLNRIKDALIMITFGVVGSNLLLMATGGFPLVNTADAAKDTFALAPVQVTDLSFDLTPSSPTMVNQVQFSVNVPDGSIPTSVAIEFDGNDPMSFKCRAQEGGSTWSCAVPNMEVGDLDQFSVVAY